MTENTKVVCYQCHKSLELENEQRILRHEECTFCQVSLYCCRMCVFYDRSSYNECREPLAERIVDKEKANFCSYFKIRGGDSSNSPTKNELFSAADALFKKKD